MQKTFDKLYAKSRKRSSGIVLRYSNRRCAFIYSFLMNKEMSDHVEVLLKQKETDKYEMSSIQFNEYQISIK